MRRLQLVILISLFYLNSNAQNNAYFYHINPYNFIRYDLNELDNFGQDRYSARFFQKLENLLKTGEGKINIVHIGGSHIQAGTLPGQMRYRFQQMNGDLNAGWGYMFPYRIARTNTPYGYYIRYTGNWQSTRNVEQRKTGNLGVGGISATTSASIAELTILLEDENRIDYSFNKLRVYYEYSGAEYNIEVDSSMLKSSNSTKNYIDFDLKNHVDSLKLTIRKTKNGSGNFTLHGIIAESAPNGIMYHSMGVNGAHVPAFLRCQLLKEQLAELKPDLVILGLGINDAYVRNFSQRNFEQNYSDLITEIRAAVPNTAIILTTNNDSYMYRQYVNMNGEKVEESMLKIAKKQNTGVWNMYEVMGGLNSITMWQKNNLAQSDKIHFTRDGYLILGDLFFNAIMQRFEQYLYEINQLTEVNN